ncbi:hypothetical protein GCK72_007419 [Caenorhabditis remanei]|uniref:BTB domain-containing protein n=1 Tax=Caenorhabditis remanei TaxID=31234 RepID=A0A6A5HH99_CAERE|nr:hypothetical protein GCK72_007419 [Caenorhabditis remanei]KAF1767460.1 hypothetical protein GCK72_007419 [Caenorhabditis remanei]
MHKICQELLEKQKNLEKTNIEIIEKLHSTESEIQKLSSGQDQILQEIQLKSNKIDEETDVSSQSITSDSSETTIHNEKIPMTGKYFMLKHVFKNVSTMNENEYQWRMYVTRNNENLSFYLFCSQSLERGKWSIETNRKHIIISNRAKNCVKTANRTFCNDGIELNSSWGWAEFIEWKALDEDFLMDDKLTAEIHVKIKNTTGIYKDNLRVFDETMEEFSDVVLVVNEEKFYVSKLFLAAHSSFFKALFLGNFNDSKKSEIKLTGIDADDFQNYLEVLYGEYSIDEFTVEGILLVADMYDTPLVIRKCEEFLLEKSKKSLKKKLQMATKYHLEALKKQCLTEIKSIADIKSVLPGSIQDLDPSIMGELLAKAISLH